MGNCCPGGGGGGTKAVALKKAAALKWLLDNKVIESESDIFKKDFSDGSMPPLHSQARKGNRAAVQCLLEVDEENEPEMKMTRVIYGSRCPLHQAAAAKENRLATCKLLLDFDPDQMHVATNDGSKPMHMLAQSEDDQAAVLNAFISKFQEQQKALPAEERKSGSQMLKEKKKDGSLLLHLACSAGLSSMVKEILKHDPTQALVVDGSVRTCLHLAAEKGHLEVMQELVKVEGITFGTKDRKGCTCLALAAIGGHADVVKLLIAKDGIHSQKSSIQ